MTNLYLAVALVCAVSTGALGDPRSNADQDRPIGFTVRLRYLALEATDPTSKVAKLIARTNKKGHLDRIDDRLNLEIVDPAKIAAYLGALRRLPGEVQRALTRGTMLLDDSQLLLGVWSPATPEQIAAISGFSKIEVDGPYLKLAPIVQIDAGRARAQIRAARTRIAELDAAIAKTQEGADLGELKRDRFRVSGIWRACAQAMADHGADARVRGEGLAEVDKAKREIAGYVVNLGGMPDDDDLAPL